jgi:N-acetyl-beta-hexosaminidase
MAHSKKQCPPILNPILNETRNLIRGILIEAGTVFGNSGMIHLGGDEVNTCAWEGDDRIVRWMEAHNVSDVKEVLKDFHRFVEGW